ETWVEMGVVLDDRDDAIAHPDHRDAWRGWLQLMNALQLRGHQPTVVTSMRAAAGAPAAAPPIRADVVLPQWQRVMDLVIDDDERRFVTELAAANVGVPDAVGDEDPDTGIMIDLAWTEDHVAVVFEADERDVADLGRSGWTVVPASVEDVAAALDGARAPDRQEERNRP